MTTPEYIANPKDHPAHRGNTNASQDRPWFGPTNHTERANMLLQMEGALLGAQLIAKQLGTDTQDYEITIRCLREDATKERRAILDGCK